MFHLADFKAEATTRTQRICLTYDCKYMMSCTSFLVNLCFFYPQSYPQSNEFIIKHLESFLKSLNTVIQTM